MSPQVLVDNRKNLPAAVAVAIGKRRFQEAEHTRQFQPKMCLFNPMDAPAEAQIVGLTVYTSRLVPRHCVRIVAWFDPAKEDLPETESI